MISNAGIETMLVVTMEFWKHDVFSGNGTYGRTLIQGLAKSGYRCGVLCCSPTNEYRSVQQKKNWVSVFDYDRIVPFTLPVKEGNWKRLDRKCCYAEAVKVISNSKEQVHSWMAKLNPSISFLIDWTGVEIYKALMSKTKAHIVYMNVRVFSAGTNLITGSEELEFYRQKEKEALQIASASYALSKSDAKALNSLHPEANIDVLHCPIREEVKQLALKYKEARVGDIESRSLLLLCCRLSPEKNVEVFFDVVIALWEEIKKAGLTVFICGASRPEEYGRMQKQRLRMAGVEFIEKPFLDTNELCWVFSSTRINFHPSLNEPYGMTIIEAHAFGAITICHNENIGAIEVLGSNTCVETNMADVETVKATLLKMLKAEVCIIRRVGAMNAALQFDQDAYQQKLGEIVKCLLN